MEWEPNERDTWVTDAERWIERIKGVRNCKIDLDSDGTVVGIHVVTGTDREPRHIVRDDEGLFKARIDLDVYYKKIGVVQVVDNDADRSAGESLTDRPDAVSATLRPAVRSRQPKRPAPRPRSTRRRWKTWRRNWTIWSRPRSCWPKNWLLVCSVPESA